MIKCKCKGCLSREIGCHTNCIDYKEYIKYLDKIKEIKKKESVYGEYKSASNLRHYNTYAIKQKFIKSKRK